MAGEPRDGFTFSGRVNDFDKMMHGAYMTGTETAIALQGWDAPMKIARGRYVKAEERVLAICDLLQMLHDQLMDQYRRQ